MKRYCKKGQSLLEYTLLLGAIIAVIIVVLLNSTTGLKAKVEGIHGEVGAAIGNGTTDLVNTASWSVLHP